MMYAKISNEAVAKYPYTIGLLRKDNPHTSFPINPSDEALAGWSVERVAAIARPDVDHTKNVTEGTPVRINGRWTQVWNVAPASPDEVAERTSQQAEQVRDERNARLAGSDWTQLADAPVDQAAWAAYRQALRDVPSQAGFPWGVTWPAQP